MKKLILIIGFLFVFIFGYSQTSVIRPYVNAGLLNGQLSTYYLDTSSTSQGKSGALTLTGGLTMGADADPGGDFKAWGTGANSTYLQWDDDANLFGRLIINNASFRQYNLRSINETSMYVEMRQDANTGATPASNIALWGAAKLDAGIDNLSESGYAEGTGIKGSYYINGTLNGDAINISGLKGEIHGTTGTATLVDNIAAVSAKYNTAINPTTGDNSLFWGWSHVGVVDYGLKLEATGTGSITTGVSVGTAATGLDFTGTYTGNVIDLSNITIDYTGSSGPAPIRIGTYASPLANADEDQSGMLRLYGQTSANGTSYDRGIFMTLKTTGTKGIFPIAGLAEVLGQAGAGPTSVTAGQFIADLHTTDAVLAATTGGGEGMYGSWFKVTAIDGATTNANSVIAPIWVDNQLYGNNADISNKEYGIRATAGGTVPKSFIGFETTSAGWDQLFYFDATAYDQAPVSNNALKVMLNTTQYYLPLSTLSTSFTVNDGTVSNPSIAFASDLNTGIYTTGADAISITAGGVEAARFVESTTTQALFGDGTAALPSIGFINDPTTGFYSYATGDIIITHEGSGRWFINYNTLGAGSNGAGLRNVVPTATIPNVMPKHIVDNNTGMGWAGADLLSLIAGGKEGIRIDGALGGIEIYMTDTTIFDNGAYISNEETDTLKITETVTKIEGDLHVTGNITQSHYGGMTYISTPGTQTIGTGGTFEKLFEGAMAYTAAHLDNFTESNGRLTYTGTVTKHFQILVFATIEGDEAAQLIQIRIAKDGTTIAATNQAEDFTAADSKNNINTGWLMELATNEYIEVYGTSDTNADTFEVQSLQIIINQMD